MPRQFNLLTKKERLLVDFLKDGAKQHNEIVRELEEHKISERTTNRILKENEGKLVFRVTREDGGIFYRLNIFPRKILTFFAIADQVPMIWEGENCLMKIKNEILNFYPNSSFNEIIEKWRTYLELTKPEWKGIIKILKDFKGKTYGNI